MKSVPQRLAKERQAAKHLLAAEPVEHAMLQQEPEPLLVHRKPAHA
jgi:hypothetical protein